MLYFLSKYDLSKHFKSKYFISAISQYPLPVTPSIFSKQRPPPLQSYLRIVRKLTQAAFPKDLLFPIDGTTGKASS
jgi:hypothetical protein